MLILIRSQSKTLKRSRGFTILELVVVLAILALVSAWGAVRWAPAEAFDAAGASRELGQLLRLGQRMALAQQREIFVSLDAAARRAGLCWDALCSQPVFVGASPARWDAPARLNWRPSAPGFHWNRDGTPALAGPVWSDFADSDGRRVGPRMVVEVDSGDVRVE